jgi:hypothetical protein
MTTIPDYTQDQLTLVIRGIGFGTDSVEISLTGPTITSRMVTGIVTDTTITILLIESEYDMLTISFMISGIRYQDNLFVFPPSKIVDYSSYGDTRPIEANALSDSTIRFYGDFLNYPIQYTLKDENSNTLPINSPIIRNEVIWNGKEYQTIEVDMGNYPSGNYQWVTKNQAGYNSTTLFTWVSPFPILNLPIQSESGSQITWSGRTAYTRPNTYDTPIDYVASYRLKPEGGEYTSIQVTGNTYDMFTPISFSTGNYVLELRLGNRLTESSLFYYKRPPVIDSILQLETTTLMKWSGTDLENATYQIQYDQTVPLIVSENQFDMLAYYSGQYTLIATVGQRTGQLSFYYNQAPIFNSVLQLSNTTRLSFTPTGVDDNTYYFINNDIVNNENNTIDLSNYLPGNYTLSAINQYNIRGEYVFDYSLPFTIDSVSFNRNTVFYTGTNLVEGRVDVLENGSILSSFLLNTSSFVIDVPGGDYTLSFFMDPHVVTFPIDYFTLFDLSYSAARRNHITLFGENLSGISSVTFGNVSSPSVVFNTSSLVVEVPELLDTYHTLTVYENNNQYSYTEPFRYLNLQTTTFSPTSSIFQSSLFLEGNDFYDISAVLFGEVYSNFSVISPTNLSVIVPFLENGDHSIKVYDTYHNYAIYETLFTSIYLSIDQVEPNEAVQKSQIRIEGNNFYNISAVMFGTERSPFIDVSIETIIAEVPVSSASECFITIYDAYNNSIQSQPFFYIPPLESSTFTPSRAVPSDTLLLSGNYFYDISDVFFGDIPSFFDIKSSVLISAQIPVSSDENCSIRIIDIYGNQTFYSERFLFIPLFNISSFNPAYGPQRSKITLYGSYFEDISYVEFGDTSTRDFTYTSNEIVVVVPNSSQQTAFITVYDDYTNLATFEQEFIYTYPSLENVSYSGVTKFPLEITGTHLENISYVNIGGYNQTVNPVSGKISLIIPPGTGQVYLTAYDIYDNSTNSVPFLYRNISSHYVTPSTATTNWVLTVVGENLSYVSKVYMGGIDRPIIEKTDTEVRFLAIAGVNNTSIYLEDPYENSTQLDTFFYKNPLVTSVNISIGRLHREVILSGINLEYTKNVFFGDISSPIYDVSSDTIVTTIPDAYGRVFVFVEDICGNQVISPTDILCLGGNASVYGVTPNRGTYNIPVKIYGEHLEFTKEVLFENEPVSILENTSTFIQIKIPREEPTNTSVTIQLIDIEDKILDVYDLFLYENPVIRTMVPQEGPPGLSVTLGGDFLETLRTVYVGDLSFNVTGGREVIFNMPPGIQNVSIYALDEVDNRYDSPFIFTYQFPLIYSLNISKGPPNAPILITGEYLQNTSYLFFGNTSAKIESWSMSTVIATIPDGSGNVSVILEDRYRNTTETTFTYQYPTVYYINPSRSAQNSSIRLEGSFLENLSYVVFNNVSSFSINTSYDWVEVNVPNISIPGEYQVPVFAYDLYGNRIQVEDFTYTNPLIRDIFPPRGPKTTQITITGDFLGQTSEVRIDRVSTPTISIEDTQITLVMPDGYGSALIEVEDLYGNIETTRFEYRTPKIHAFPSYGAPKQPVRLEGEFLENTYYLTIGEKYVLNLDRNVSWLDFLLPDGDGEERVILYNEPFYITYGPFFRYHRPNITSIHPSRGPPNAPIEISGEYLQNSSFLRFENTSTPLYSWSMSRVTSIIPQGTGIVSLYLEDRYTNVATSQFTYEYPTVLQLRPRSSPKNSSVILTGLFLQNISSVLFNNVSSSSIQVFYSSEGYFVEAKVPPGESTVNVLAYDRYGNSVQIDDFTYTNMNLSYLSPSSGPFSLPVSILGSFIGQAIELRVNGIPITIDLIQPERLTFTLPYGYGTEIVEIEDVYGNIESTTFEYRTPKIYSFPLYGAPKQLIRIDGEFLENTSYVSIGFDNIYQLDSNVSWIEFHLPDSNGSGTVVLHDTTGYTINSSTFTYQRPSITSINPSRGPPKSLIEIVGNYLENSTFLYFDNASAEIISRNESSVFAIVPEGSNEVSVYLQDRYTNIANISFTYDYPTVFQYNPSVAPQNSSILIEGIYLENIREVWFGNSSSLSIKVSPNQVEARVPLGSSTVQLYAYDVYRNRVTLPYFTYGNPNISSITPSKGPFSIPVTVQGTFLRNTSSIRMDGYNISWTDLQEVSITFPIPPGYGTKIIEIEDVYGNLQTTQYEYRTPLIRTAPLHGSPQQPIRITGDFLDNLSFVRVVESNQYDMIRNVSFIDFVIPFGDGSGTYILYDNTGYITQGPSFEYDIFKLVTVFPPGSAVGSEIKINGSFLTNTSEIKFGSEPANFSVIQGELFVKVPQGSGSVSILAYDLYNNPSSIPFEYLTPQIRLVEPPLGVQRDRIFLSGDYLQDTSYVVFGNTSTRSFVYNSVTSKIEMKIPDGSGIVQLIAYDKYNNPAYNSFEYVYPVIRTLDPPNGPQRQSIYVYGSFLANTSYFVFGNTSTRTFTYETDEDRIRVKVPDGSGNVSVFAYDLFNNRYDFPLYVYQNPKAISINVSKGFIGSTVFLSGNYLNGVYPIYFGQSIVTDYEYVNNQTIKLTVPEGKGNVSIYAYDPYLNEVNIPSFDYLSLNLSSFNPSYGPTGTTVILRGSLLSEVSSVKFGEEFVDPVYENGSIRVTVPNGYGPTTIYVYDNFGNPTTIGPFYYENPFISSLTPSSGPKGQSIRIDGEYLQNISFVNFGDFPCEEFTYGNSSLRVKVPEGSGPVTLNVIDLFGNESYAEYTYLNPFLRSIEAQSYTKNWILTFLGENLTNSSTVEFGVDRIPLATTNPATCIIPSGEENVLVRILDYYGNYTDYLSFEYKNPILREISAYSGTFNSSLILFGDHLEHIQSVYFNTTRNVGLIYPEKTQVTVYVPNVKEYVTLKAVDACGNEFVFGQPFFGIGGNASIYNVSPDYGANGATVKIIGENLWRTRQVTFDSKEATLLQVDDLELTVVVPKVSREIVDVVVTSIDNSSVLREQSFVYRNPRIDRVTPSAVTKNMSIVLSGINLSHTYTVQFKDNSPFRPNRISDYEIECKVPSGTGESVIYVTDEYQNVVNISFVYQNPRITGINPLAGAAHRLLNISGLYLQNSSTVLFGNELRVPLRIETSFVTIEIPSGNTSSLISILDKFGNVIDFPDAFVYENPRITFLDPDRGVRNTSMKIRGQFFLDLSYVQFGSHRLYDFNYTPTSIEVFIPQGEQNVSVSVTDLYQNTTNVASFQYAIPSITTLIPLEGPSRSPLNLSGNYLVNLSYIRIGQNVSFKYTEQGVEVKVPLGVGNVSVYAVDLFDSVYESPVQFTYRDPILSQINPSRGPPRQIISLSGNYLQNISFVSVESNVGLSSAYHIPFVSESLVRAKVPDSRGITQFFATDKYGNQTNRQRYDFENPFILNFSPNNGSRGDTVDLVGGFLSDISHAFIKTYSGMREIPFVKIDDGKIRVTLVNSRGNVYFFLYDSYGNEATHPDPFLYTETFVPEVPILPFYGKPGSILKVNLPNAYDYVADCSYVFFNEIQKPLNRGTYLEVIIPNGTTTLIELYDEQNNVIGFNRSFKYDTILIDKIYPVSGFPGSTLVIHCDNVSNVDAFFGELPLQGATSYLENVSTSRIHPTSIRLTVPDISYNGKIILYNDRIGVTPQNFLVRQPRIDSITFTKQVSIQGNDLTGMVRLSFVKNEEVKYLTITITDTAITGPLPVWYGTVSMILLSSWGKEYPLGNYTYPPEIPQKLYSRPIRNLTADNRLYFSNGRTIETLKETIYIHKKTITSIVFKLPILYFGDNESRIYRYNVVTRRDLPPYVAESPISMKVHENKLYVLGHSLNVFDLSTHLPVTYTLPIPIQGLAFDGNQMYMSRSDGVIQRSSLTLQEVEPILFGLTNPKDLVIDKGQLYVSGSIRHYRLDTLEQVSYYETDDEFVSLAIMGRTLYLSNTTQNQIDILPLLEEPVPQFYTMTSTGTENSSFELTGEGLERVSKILFDLHEIKELRLITSTKIIGKIPKGYGTPRIIILDQDNVHLEHRFLFHYENPQITLLSPFQAYEKETLYLYGEYLDKVTSVFIGDQFAMFVWVDQHLEVTLPNGFGSQSIVFMDNNLNIIDTQSRIHYLRLEAAICFVEGTLVHTDQGPVPIQKLMPGHSVYGKEIKGITETYYTYDEIVCIEPHAFYVNYPLSQTILSKHHKILIRGKMIEAQALVGHPGVSYVPYHGEKLYNVLLEEEGRMNIHGMICETLDPSNPIAKKFRWLP